MTINAGRGIMRKTVFMCAMFSMMPVAVNAEETIEESGGQAGSESVLPLPGAEVEQWLAMQRNGDQQSELPQSVSPAYHEKAAQRFMKTLDQAIPAPTQEK